MLHALLTMAALILGDPQPVADPAATALLAEARAQRAHWTDFPGFQAQIEVRLDGRISRGALTIEPGGHIQLRGLTKPAESWARRTLRSLVDHRRPDASGEPTPCAFADDVGQHPQGRAIRLLGDDYHSSYRIRDCQVVQVNRQMKDHRFSINVLENQLNPDGKYLPSAFVVSFWRPSNGELLRTEATRQIWTRQGSVDLPLSTLVVTTMKKGASGDEPGDDAAPAESDLITVRQLSLSHHQPLKRPEP